MFLLDSLEDSQKAFLKIQHKDMQEVYKKTIKDLKANKCVVLDIGDRTCATAKRIIRKYKPSKLIINDIISSELKKSYKKLPKKNTELFIGNATKTKFKSNSIDRIIVQFVLNELIGNLERAFNEWKRILKPGGIIIISEHFLNPKLKQDRIFLECFGDFHEKNISLKDCEKTMKNVGLKIIKKFKNNHCWYIVASNS